MSDTIEVRVPDLGDAGSVDVIEILVAVGDEVSVDQSLISLESDKATMDVPSPAAGTVTDINVAVGDKVAEGSVIVSLGGASTATATSTPAAAPAAAAPKAPSDPTLYRRIPRGRPRSIGNSDRALSQSRRCLSECWVHSVQGSPACCQGDFGSTRYARARHHVFRTNN